MPTLNWCDDLALGIAEMDTTHQEFVALLAAVESADDAALLPAWQALVDHTQVHFDNEDRYMLATRFAATNCHTTHHQMVLDVLRQGLAMGQAGDLAPIRQMTRELATWFPQHADSMDAALAMHLQRVGFDPATGTIAHAGALPAEALHGCGGATCTPHDVSEHEAAAA
ncbi:hemerythrin domain-containing protein [Ottowia sp.]|uniref:hemerythrin domain-containing protein n=1 Tax=Ottowia sp. TaxID=1898956 RepID=UPI002C5E0609|nr:hemerythrin domain-containing protein [Ottowia sp.]HOB65354.1 hemerythrin domain-containing protein [Ottowia sp.]HPZ57855.1 hemerythrin domain-containing protein [Ottowia sp.]HQD47811.1 hemerythrin domain-containing protein [Ottowia sp.]